MRGKINIVTRITNGSGVRLPDWQATEMRERQKPAATSRETSYRSDVNEPLQQGNDIMSLKVSGARRAFILQRYVSLSGGTLRTRRGLMRKKMTDSRLLRGNSLLFVWRLVFFAHRVVNCNFSVLTYPKYAPCLESLFPSGERKILRLRDAC